MNIYRSTQKEIDQLLACLKKRSGEERPEVTQTVKLILEEVRRKGNIAIADFTRKFDQVDVENLEVDKSLAEAALKALDPILSRAVQKAADNIRAFHEKQKENSWFTTGADGAFLGQKITPMDRVGVYVPGGTAPLPSSVLMNVIPAKVAGVNEVILFTPPGKQGTPDPMILACAALVGADRIFQAGGAQAVAAMAYGTETVPKVDKITGPGNIYVATAKKMVYGVCDIDMIAGPSEILIIADENARADYVAADLLSQAEHDILSSAILVTVSQTLIEKVMAEINRQVERLSRKEIIQKSLKDYGAIVLVNSVEEAVALSNRIAPEHLEICVQNPMALLGKIKNAGAIFLGEYSPEPLGDYMAGPNHILPTNGTARFYSPLSVNDFTKKSSVIAYTQEALASLWKDVAAFAGAEGLEAHEQSVRIRFEEDKNE